MSHRLESDWQTGSGLAGRQTVQRAISESDISDPQTTYIADLAGLPSPSHTVQFGSCLVDGLLHSIQEEVAQSALLHSIRIDFTSNSLQNSLTFLLVLEDAQEISFVGKHEFDCHISEEIPPLVVFDYLVVFPALTE